MFSGYAHILCSSFGNRIGMMVNQILGPAFITTAYLLPYSHIHGCPFFGHQDRKIDE